MEDYYAVVSTWLELLQCILARHDVGWLTFGLIPTKLVKDGIVSVASIFKSVLLTFFSLEEGGWNMESIGVNLECSRGKFLLRSTFGCLLGDVKGLQECLSLKGASASKPCPFCRNVLGRTEDAYHPYFVHHSSTEVHRFDLLTPSRFDELSENLAAAFSRPGSTRTTRDQMEKAFGLKYDKHAVAFCPAAAKIAKTPDSIFPDSMHNLLASGGILQYELNQLTRRIIRLGYSRQDLDRFAGIIGHPKNGITRLPKGFFAERILEGDGSHLKGYAGEVLTLLAVLSYFCTKVLVPKGYFLRNAHIWGTRKGPWIF